MKIKLGDLAAAVGGRVVGDPNLPICGAAPLSEAQAGEITLIDAPERLRELRQRSPTAIVRASDCDDGDFDNASIVVDDVHRAFASIVSRFRPPRQ